ILVLIVLLVIGFATISTSIMINGNANLSFNENYFNVIFTEATTDGTYNISEDKQEINYTTKNLSIVGDKAIIEYKVKNDSYQYDANVLLDPILNDQNSDKYTITYEILDSENSYSLESKRTVTAKVIVELIKSVSSPINISMKLKLNLTAVGRNEFGDDSYTIVYNGNGADSGSMANQEVSGSSETSLLANTFTKTNYSFAGWGLSPDGDALYKDQALIKELSSSGETVNLYAIWVQTVQNISNVGTLNDRLINASGYYRLEVWGAQGGTVSVYSRTMTGGYGAYATGVVKLNYNDHLYTVVGGAGSLSSNGVNTTKAGGANGGGSNTQSQWGYGGTGGGATHIALNDSRNTLANYSNAMDKVLIVAGGGGAGGVEQNGGRYTSGGNAGGIRGNNGGTYNCAGPGQGCPTSGGIGGSQTTGAAFGKGANGSSWAGAAGAGWYGGTVDGGGAGGSSYIASSNLITYNNITKRMTCYSCATSNETNNYTISNTCVSGNPTENCAKTGNGYARITFISANN
ncbi:MAG: InlB B-repeat-containing protein, partial [Bacilli bacterium]|nr:InlB B-repeat-containing protein [Bacilli bacterium]